MGLIEPHLMAGFGGGMKNILPGVARAETIGAHDLFLYVPSLSAVEAEYLFYFEHSADTHDVIRKGFAKLGPHATVAVFPEGGATYPIVGHSRSC